MKVNAVNHGKMHELAGWIEEIRQLPYEDCHTLAVGYIERLIDVTHHDAPRGDIGRYSDRTIARKAGWTGEPGPFIAALLTAGWLDRHEEHRLLVHDWSFHAMEATRLSLERRGEITFADGSPIRGGDGGCVYIVQSGEAGPIKIGWSSHLTSRLQTLGASVPGLHLLGIIDPGDRALEKRLHRQFSDHRMDREWFHPSLELIQWVRENTRAADGQWMGNRRAAVSSHSSASSSASADLKNTDHVPPEEPAGTAHAPAKAPEGPQTQIEQPARSKPQPTADRGAPVNVGASGSNGKQAELAVESVDKTESEVRAVWPACQAAALQLSGKRWGALTPAYQRMAAGCLRNRRKAEARAPPETLVHAIHGAWITFGEGRRQNYDARKYLRPKTVYAASNFDSYVDEYRDTGVSRAAPGSDPESERLREARIAEASRQWRASQGRDEIV